MEYLHHLNQTLFLLINAGTNASVAVIDAATVLAERLIWIIPIGLIAAWLWRSRARHRLGRPVQCRACPASGVSVDHAIDFPAVACLVHSFRGPDSPRLGKTMIDPAGKIVMTRICSAEGGCNAYITLYSLLVWKMSIAEVVSCRGVLNQIHGRAIRRSRVLMVRDLFL